MSGYSRNVRAVAGDGAMNYSEIIKVINALEVLGIPAAGQVPVFQADGSVAWATVSGGTGYTLTPLASAASLPATGSASVIYNVSGDADSSLDGVYIWDAVDGIYDFYAANPGSSSANYEAALYANLLAMASQQSADYGLPNGRLWACADAANLALTNAVIESGYARDTAAHSLGDNLVPAMTSNTAPSGTASASSNYMNEIYYAFDHAPATYWLTNVGTAYTSNAWIRYDFASNQAVYGYAITPIAGNWATAWIFQGSTDGTTWTNLDSRSGPAISVRTEYTLSAPASTYSKFRLYVTTAQNPTNVVSLYEFEILALVSTPNPATIIGNSYALSGAAAGRLILRGYNADATAALDIGNSGSSKIEVYQSIDGNTTWSAALAIESVESLGDNLYRYTTPELDLSAAIGIGFKLQSNAVNFRLLDVLAIWRNAS